MSCIDCDRLDEDASLKKRVITIAVSSNMVAEHGRPGEQLAHKKAVGSPHAAWRIIARLERTETSDDNEEQAASARKSVGNVEPELLEIYDGIVTLMEEKLDSDENVVTQRRMRRTSSRREFWGATESSCCLHEGFVLLALAGPPRRLGPGLLARSGFLQFWSVRVHSVHFLCAVFLRQSSRTWLSSSADPVCCVVCSQRTSRAHCTQTSCRARVMTSVGAPRQFLGAPNFPEARCGKRRKGIRKTKKIHLKGCRSSRLCFRAVSSKSVCIRSTNVMTILAWETARDARQQRVLAGRPPQAWCHPCWSRPTLRTGNGGKLIPNSDFSSGIHVPPNHEPEECDPGTGFDRPFARLLYAALAAPGPTGTRAEHITDLLNRFSQDPCQQGPQGPPACFYAFLVASSRRLRTCSLARVSAGSARRMAPPLFPVARTFPSFGPFVVVRKSKCLLLEVLQVCLSMFEQIGLLDGKF